MIALDVQMLGPTWRGQIIECPFCGCSPKVILKRDCKTDGVVEAAEPELSFSLFTMFLFDFSKTALYALFALCMTFHPVKGGEWELRFY